MENFGSVKNGQAHLYTIENDFLILRVTDYGASLVSVIIKELNRDIVLGYNDAHGYEENGGCLGGTVGRNCNRIENARFSLDGVTYSLAANNGPNNLHSGPDGYQFRLFEAKEFNDRIEFTLSSPDGDQGFPGNLNLKVVYRLTKDGFVYSYEGLSDRDTILNVTNHTYWNLNGHGTPNLNGHMLSICSDHFVAVDRNGLACGPIREVEDTPLDFRNSHDITDHMNTTEEIVSIAKGYDHPYLFESGAESECLCVKTEDLAMHMATDLPSVQLYTANYLTGKEINTKENKVYPRQSGVCFETQFCPNAINREDVSQPILAAGETVRHETAYRYEILK